MQFREDRKSGNQLPALGLGCMRFPRDKSETEQMILTAIDGGVNFFDTAYAWHRVQSQSSTLQCSNLLYMRVPVPRLWLLIGLLPFVIGQRLLTLLELKKGQTIESPALRDNANILL